MSKKKPTMNWKKLLSRKRHNVNRSIVPLETGRTPFTQDQDRIKFSSFFRRLGRKTQVHPLVNNDHIHTRLSHSLETASVGRTLGMQIGYFLYKRNELPLPNTIYDVADIVQAACLAHDIGNPPFGHAGEDGIRQWFVQWKTTDQFNHLVKKCCFSESDLEDFLRFDGNAQTIRIVSKLEYYSNSGGMRLTCATLGALLKYPWTSDYCKQYGKDKFSIFRSEKLELDIIAKELGLLQKNERGVTVYARHPLAWLTEAADDICYSILDIEDAFEMGILTLDDLKQILLPIVSSNKQHHDEWVNEILPSNLSPRRIASYIRGKAIGVLADHAVKIFKKNYCKIMQGTLDNSLLDRLPLPLNTHFITVKDITNQKIFAHPRKIELEIGLYTIVERILDTFIEGVIDYHDSVSSFKSKRVRDILKEDKIIHGDIYTSIQVVIDYLSGMTDHYAVYLSNQFSGMVDHYSTPNRRIKENILNRQ